MINTYCLNQDVAWPPHSKQCAQYGQPRHYIPRCLHFSGKIACKTFKNKALSLSVPILTRINRSYPTSFQGLMITPFASNPSAIGPFAQPTSTNRKFPADGATKSPIS